MKPVKLKGHILREANMLEIGTRDPHLYRLNQLPEDLCAKLCEHKDNGPRYSHASRHNYWTRFDGKNDLIYGNAKAAIQSVFIKKAKYISMQTWVIIEPENK